jgi:AhpD family alkylhydroperoxidase
MFDQHNFRTFIRAGALAIAAGALGVIAQPVLAADTSAKVAEAYADIEKTFGGVPTFVRQMPAAALPGAWQELKDLELSEDTALSPKTKALISLAVASQIPCTYCIWADTNSARQAGATDEEIGEAVAMAALTRHWSTIFNGLQVDFDTFKQELGGESAKEE